MEELLINYMICDEIWPPYLFNDITVLLKAEKVFYKKTF